MDKVSWIVSVMGMISGIVSIVGEILGLLATDHHKWGLWLILRFPNHASPSLLGAWDLRSGLWGELARRLLMVALSSVV